MPHPAPAHKSFADRSSLYQEITNKIIAELEQGRVPWVQPWSSNMAGAAAPFGLPCNAATSRPYTGINVLILWIAGTERGFTSQKWLTFRQALKIGAHVRKGEQGTSLVYADRFIRRFYLWSMESCRNIPIPPMAFMGERYAAPMAKENCLCTRFEPPRLAVRRFLCVGGSDLNYGAPPNRAGFGRAIPCSNVAEERNGIIQKRVALVAH